MLQAPHFATDGRLRGPHCKSHDELEAEQMANVPQFRARPIKYAFYDYSSFPFEMHAFLTGSMHTADHASAKLNYCHGLMAALN